MASACSLLSDEQFLCSICLNVFTEPVSISCGHNYCKTCITGYWGGRNTVHCPLCMRKFRRRPQLHINTGFRDIVELFKSMKVQEVTGEDDIVAKPGEVLCDICSGPKLKAQKTCLVCLASYCGPHLEPHQRVNTFKKHRLIDPVSNLEDRVCKKHEKVLEFFCRQDQICVCFMCSKDNHATHESVPLEHAFREKEVQLDHVMSEMKMRENTKSKSIEKIKKSGEQSERAAEKEIADIAEVFTALAVSLRRSQDQLTEVIREKQKALQKQTEDHVTQLEQEVAELRRRRSEMEQLLQTGDHLRILQSWQSLCFPAHTEDPLSPSSPPFTPDLPDIRQHVGMVKEAVAQMEKTLSDKMPLLIHKVRFDGCEATKLMTDWFVKEVWTPPQDRLMKIQQLDAVDVTLDPDTAHTRLEVSEDGKQLRIGNGPQSLHVLPEKRFRHQHIVLGKEGYSSGRFYYEVQVSGSKGWLLGVIREATERDGHFFPIWDRGWTLCGFYNEDDALLATRFSTAPLHLKQRQHRVGVFVDCDKGEVSFHNLEDRTEMCSYTGCSFLDDIPGQDIFLCSMTGVPIGTRAKLCPVFGIFEDDFDSLLVISPVAP